MKKILCLCLVLIMTLSCCLVSAEGNAFVLSGFDSESAGHHWESNEFFKRMEEKTGVSFTFDQYTDAARWTARKAEMKADGELPDVLFKAEMTDREIYELYGRGVIVDLKPYLAEYAPNLSALLAAHPEWEAAITLKDGSIPALPNFNELQNNNVMWINSTWLKNLNLEVPKTKEELTEVLKAFRDRDPNRNGRNDETPLSFVGMWDLRYLAHAFGIVTNDCYVALDENGKVTSPVITEEYRAFLTWLNELWNERLISHNGFVTGDSMRQITDAKAAVPYGMFLSSSATNLLPTEAVASFNALMPLEYNGKQVYRDFLGYVVKGTFAITSACKEPEKLVAWVDHFYTPEGSQMALYGLEGTEYFWNEDGNWEWMADPQTVIYEIMPANTLSEGGVMPGMTEAVMQQKYGDKQTRTTIQELANFHTMTVLPVPEMTVDPETEERIASILQVLAPYVEDTLACFVCGDLKLDDENWNTFVQKAQELGLNEMTEIWQGCLMR